jgi:zinc D-Ala-D-Ala dipeptidase
VSGDFAYVDERVPGIRWDAKYATWDNFTGRPVDGYHANRVVGTVALCTALERVRDEAASHGFGLLLWDAYRPQRAVDDFLRWSRQPEDGRTKLRYYPNIARADMFELGYVARRSGHSRGSTVDLTLHDLATGEPVEMGGDHDLMDVVSHHGADDIPKAATRNRETLRAIMEASGFSAHPAEWWHSTSQPEVFASQQIRAVSRNNVPGHHN